MRVSSRRLVRVTALLLAGLAATGCLFGEFMARNVDAFVSPMREVRFKVDDPVIPDARLAVLWVGHATALVQIEDKFLLTDPVFTSTVGQVSRRLVEPGIDVESLPPIDAVLISHMHFDHLSLGSLEMLESRVRFLALPEGGLTYLTDFRFPARELRTWESIEASGMTITAVPVGHSGFRYAFDIPWMTRSFTGYVVEYRGLTVYFPGDTSFAPEAFARTARCFTEIDLALLPIAPVHPRDFMKEKHMDPAEALDAFELLGARHMVPIHFDTFENSLDSPGEARALLEAELASRRALVGRRVSILEIGEQTVVLRQSE
jgi:N-acyl-phosphatidylethanolamine-hydrolysing phospholipase D